MDDIEENVEYNEDEYDVDDIIIEGNDGQNMIDILKKYKKHKKNYKRISQNRLSCLLPEP